jgi:tetratricopeptide (TPR) repeat protein
MLDECESGSVTVTNSTREDFNHAKELREKGELAKSLEIVDSLLNNKDVDDKLLILDGLILKVEICWRLGKLDDGLAVVKTAENLLNSEVLEKHKDELQKRKSQLLSQSGIIHWYRGELQQAMEYHETSLRIKEELGDKEGIPSVLNNLGLVYWTKGNLDKANVFYKKSLAAYEELGDENGISSVLNNLANISSTRGDLDQALDYLHRSLEIRERLDSKQDIARSLINIGVIHRLKGNLDQATEFYNKSLAIQLR